MEVLGTKELDQLLELLSTETQSLQEVETRFRQLFREDIFTQVAMGMQFLHREAGYLIVNLSQVESIHAVLLLDVMRRADCIAAKAVLYDLLLHLEQLLREDAKKVESARYRSMTATKDAKRRDARDILDNEGTRLRSVVKLFALEILTGKANTSKTAVEVLAMEQATLDSALDTWQKNASEVKELFVDLLHCMDSEAERASTGPLTRVGVVAYTPSQSASHVIVPSVAKAPLPPPPVFCNDLKMLLTVGGTVSSLFLLDSQAHSTEWKTARELLREAATAPLDPTQQQALTLALTANTVARLGLQASSFCQVVSHNPEIGAALVHRMKDPGPLLEAMMSAAPQEQTETVMLHAAKSLRQVHVFKYVQQSLQRIKAAAANTKLDLVLNMVSTLHQLLTKYAKDNKELYISDAQKPELDRLLQEYASHAEVSSRREDLLK